MSIILEKPRLAPDDFPEMLAPAWAHELVADGVTRSHPCAVPNVGVQSTRSARFTLITAHIRKARSIPREQLGEAIYGCYIQIAQLLCESPASHPIRYWNHICHIHQPVGQEMDRYMAFNVGRFRAFEEWYGGEANFDKCIATASGVGCRGEDIVIHALAADRVGIAVANPRQVQPFRYSKRFGPRPPCFARATLVPMLGSESMLLIGGTASIRGEESMFIGDLSRQLDETFENLQALLTHAADLIGGKATLANMSDLRIYVVDPSTTATIDHASRAAMPNAREVQLLDADLCRKELLVEIEGRAIL